MKLTPWMLTVATFLMVGAIAVSYVGKTVSAARMWSAGAAGQPALDSPPHRSQPSGPAGLRSPQSQSQSLPHDTGEMPDPGSPVVMQSPDAAAKSAGTEGPPPDVVPPVHVQLESPEPDEPADVQPSAEPETFVTEQYRGLQKSESRFVEDRAASGRVSARPSQPSRR